MTDAFAKNIVQWVYEKQEQTKRRESMPINVTSEIGKLKKVMLHKPGVELEHLVPEELERLLFDDIPYLKTARSEHSCFAGILRE